MNYYSLISSMNKGVIYPPIITSGLILHYDFSNTSCYSGSGTTVNDLSASPNGAFLQNGVAYNSNYGGTLVFDGVDDFLQVNAQPALTNACTIETWCNLDTVISNDKWLVGVEESYRLLYNGTSLQFVVKTVNNGWYSAGTVITMTTTNHINANSQIVAVYNGSRLKFYINGVLQTTSSTNISGNLFSMPANPYVLIKDGSTSTGIDYGKGKVYQHRLYNTALSDADVLTNFNANKTKFGL